MKEKIKINISFIIIGLTSIIELIFELSRNNYSTIFPTIIIILLLALCIVSNNIIEDYKNFLKDIDSSLKSLKKY